MGMKKGEWEKEGLEKNMREKRLREKEWGEGREAEMENMIMVYTKLVWNVYNARKEMP